MSDSLESWSTVASRRGAFVLLVSLNLTCTTYDVPGGYAEAPWYYEFSDHRDFAGARLPAAAVATFEKSDGPWEYFRGRITSVTPGGR